MYKKQMPTERETAPYRKKSKKSRSDSKARSNHKHRYDKVIVNSLFAYHWAGRCSVCGRVDENAFGSGLAKSVEFYKDRVDNSGLTISVPLTVPEIEKKFPGYPILTLNWKTMQYEPVTGEEEEV